MNYGLLISLFPMSAIAGFFISCFICGFIQTLYELRGKGTPNVNPLLVVLSFPCWIIVWFVSYYIFNNYH
jgi:hypothetical protein